MMDTPTDLQHSKSQFYASSTTLLNGHDRERYLQSGPGSGTGEHYELTTMDSPREPLLNSGSIYQQPAGYASSQSLMQSPPTMYNDGPVREAPLHRSQLSQGSTTFLGMDRTMSPAPMQRDAPPYQSRSNSPYMERQQTSGYDPRGQSPYGQGTQSPFMERGPSAFDPRSASPHLQQGYHNQQLPPPPQGGGNMAGRGAHRT